MVLSRQDAEALGIQLDPVEQSVEDQQDEAAATEDQLEDMPEQECQEPEMQQQDELTEYQSENQELDSEFHRELQAGMQSDLQSKSQETAVKSTEAIEPQVETGPPAISVPEDVPQIEAQQGTENKVKVQSTKEEEDGQTTTVSLDAVSQQLGEDGGDGESSANDVLSNIIQSLFNPNEPNQSNVSIVPRMVGGKRKLCLRLPASTASALLAQTGSPLATSFTEGGIPKKIKIVIPPNSMSNSAGSIVTSLTNSAIAQENKVIKMSMANQSAKTTGPARLDPDTLPSSSSMSLMSSPAKSSSKPFLASLFSSTSSSPSSSMTVTPVNPPQQTQKKPLGSTENPIQLVQEGNSFRSLQPLTPDQLKHIASVLKQNRQAILSGTGDAKAGTSSGTDGEGGKRRVVYDAASNTRIVYRVVTPGELKKSPSVSTPTIVKSTVSTPTAASGVRGRGRGRGRPPRTAPHFVQTRKPSHEESDSDDLGEEETSLGANIDMSKVKNKKLTLVCF